MNPLRKRVMKPILHLKRMNETPAKLGLQPDSVWSDDSITYEIRKTFLEELKLLNKSEKEEIFRILKRNNCSFSENSNGIFFDVQRIDSQTFSQLQSFIDFCKKNRKNLEEREQEQQKASQALAHQID